MTRRAWVRLDNASNIFLAARSDVDTKVFRMVAELDEDVDPHIVQRALDATFDHYPLYHAVLRRGLFWHYLQDSDLRPVAGEDVGAPCAPIYRPDRRELLFRVTHHRRRIILEVFHVLSDGGGALRFLTDLVGEYCRLRYPSDPETPPTTTEGIPLVQPGPEGAPGAPPVDLSRSLVADGFTRYFRRRRRDAPADRASPGAPRAEPPGAAPSSGRRRARIATARRWALRRVHRPSGTRTPDHRTRLVEVTMPAADVLALARAEQVSLTMYLTAVFVESVRIAAGGLGHGRTVAVSVPVDLRQFFPSTSPRNFFATARVEHTYGLGADTVGAIAQGLEGQLRAQITPEALEARVRALMRLQQSPLLRIVPRPLKDLGLGLANRINNRGLTVAISNMGRVTLPEPGEAHVRRLYLQVSAARPQFCSMSHDGRLTISFTSPFLETDHVREFVRSFTARGIDVSIAAARTSEAELAEAPGGAP
ncbi:alcohol acetyltransferase [Brachybacterium sp. AOP25-B2-12]|uniref:alcohol acetyltransferase n=1 Tax=Brachybacterium sp. AOP25-B2-12 TaxID=3457710 RepID=UPI0040342545